MIKRREQSKKLLGELKDLKEQGKTSKDIEVKEKLEKMQQVLQISDDQWIKKENNNLGDVIKKMETITNQGPAELIKRPEVSAKDVLESASGGLALRGVYINNGGEVKDQCQALQIPEQVKLVGPTLDSIHDEKEFTSNKRHSQYKKRLRNHGYSVSASTSGGYGPMSASISGSYFQNKENEVEVKDQTDTAYYSKQKYVLVPTASFTFEEGSMRLSKQCISKLQEIEKIITTTSEEHVRDKNCESFFKSFGSHVNVGPIQFGGTFIWNVEYQKKTTQKSHTIKQLCSKALSAFVNASCMGAVGISVDTSISSFEGKFEGEFDKEDKESLRMNITTNGGPNDTSVYSQWRSGLVGNNSTWSVIDRGSNFSAIWKILKYHEEEFQDLKNLEFQLVKSWEKITHLKDANFLVNRDLLEAERTLSEVFSLAKECCELQNN